MQLFSTLSFTNVNVNTFTYHNNNAALCTTEIGERLMKKQTIVSNGVLKLYFSVYPYGGKCTHVYLTGALQYK